MSNHGFFGAVRDALFSDWGRIQADAALKQSAVEVVLDDDYHSGPSLAELLLQQDPTRIVVARWSGDNDIHTRETDGADWLHRQLDRGLAAGAYLELENEPVPPGLDVPGRDRWFEMHVAWYESALDEADRLGVPLVVGNWSVLTPDPRDWSKYYRVLWRVVEGPHLIGWHLYYIDKPDHPMTKAAIANVQAALDICPGLYGHGILSETGKDHIWQVPDSAAGWQKDESQETHSIRMTWFFELMRPLGLLGATEFIWRERFQPAQEDHRDFNIAGQDDFNHQISVYPYGEWLNMGLNWQKCTLEIVATNGVNVRASASTSAARLGGIAAGNYPALVTEETVLNQGYTWKHIQAEVLDGWIAIRKDAPYEQYANITLVVEPPPPPPAEDCKDEQAEIARLQAENEAQQDLLAKYQKYMGQMEQIREEFYSRLRQVGDDLDGEINNL